MTNPTKRRPLPALVFLVALTLLTALVWWRVLNRDSGADSTAAGCPTSSAPAGTVLPAPSTISVSVLNSTDRSGLAKSVAGALGKVGFAVAGYGNDIGHAPIPGVAEIRFPTAQRDAAVLLGYYFPGATQVPLTTSETKIVVSLGLRYRRLPTAATIAAAQAKDKVTVRSTRSPAPAGSPSPSC